MPSSLLQPGSLINDNWRLEREIETGGTSSLWEAENLRLEGRVAIKFLRHEHAHDSAFRERFLRESQAICRVRSPHVVQVLDRGISHELPYLVMELLEGEDLGQLLAREGTLSLSTVASMLDQLCRGLARVHAAGYVHRDVKPENVFVIHEGDGGHFIKLLDFGIAKLIGGDAASLTQTDTVVGTAHYLSPEQISHPKAVNQRADIWALGVLAYRMLLGTPAFDGESWQELAERILKAELTLPTAQHPHLPAALDAWFSTILQRDPGMRYATVQEASAAFARIARAHASGVVPRTELRAAAVAPALVVRIRSAAHSRLRFARRPLWAGLAGVAALAVCAWVGMRPKTNVAKSRVERTTALAAAVVPVAPVVPPRPVATPSEPAPPLPFQEQPVSSPRASEDHGAAGPIPQPSAAKSQRSGAGKPASQPRRMQLRPEEHAPATPIIEARKPVRAVKDRGF